MSRPDTVPAGATRNGRVRALRMVCVLMLVATAYTVWGVCRLLWPHGVLLPPGMGYAAGVAVAANVLGCVLSFFVSGQWALKSIFAIVSFLGCVLILLVASIAHGAVVGFPGVLLI